MPTDRSSLETSRSLATRHPWLAWVGFLVVMGAVGSLLAALVGERPHHRRDQWNVFTDVPLHGSGADGGPALGEMAVPFAANVVHNWVAVRVQERDGEPLGHREVALVRPSDGAVLATGVTEPRGGLVRVPVPPIAEPDYYRGDLHIVLLTAQRPDRVVNVPPPTKGKSDVRISTERGVLLDLEVRGLLPAARPLDRDARIRCARPNGTLDPRSLGIRVVDGRARIGGLLPSAPVTLDLTIPDREPTQRRLEITANSTSHGTILAGPLYASADLALTGEDGSPLVRREVLVTTNVRRDSRVSLPARRSRTDPEGRLRVELISGLDAHLSLHVVDAPELAAELVRPVITEGTHFDWGRLVLKAGNRVLRGRILDHNGGPPPAGTVVACLQQDGTVAAPVSLQADGSFWAVLSGPPVPPWLLDARSPALAGAVVVSAPSSDISLRLEAAGGLRGVVAATDARAREALRIQLWNGAHLVTSKSCAWSVGGGTYVLADLAPGTYDVRCILPLHPVQRHSVVVTSGAITDVDPFDVPAVADGEILVRDATDQPVAMARVSVQRSAETPDFEATTGPFGRVLIPQPRSVPQLQISVHSRDGSFEGSAQSFPIIVRLTPWARPTLLLPPIPEDLRDRWILVTIDALGANAHGIATGPVLASANGQVDLPNLAPGAYRVLARAISRTEPHVATALTAIADLTLESGAAIVRLEEGALDPLAAAVR